MRKALKMHKKELTREKGAVLIIALLVGLAMLIMTSPFLFKHSNQFRNTEKSNRELSAFNLAEAGVERGLWEENMEFIVEGGIEWITDADGNQTATIPSFTAADNTVMGDIDLILTAPSGADPDTRILEATGKPPFIASRTVDRTVRIFLEKYFKSIFDFGFFVEDYFYIRTNYWIDSYDSRDGPYGGDNMAGTWGYFGMNSSNTDPPSFTIDQGASSNVYGKIAAGAGTVNHPDYDPNNPDVILEDIIDVPTEDTFVGDAGRMILQEPFEMPSVNVYDLPPRDMFESPSNPGNWFIDEFEPPSDDLQFPADPGTYNPYLQPGSGDIHDEYEMGTLEVPMGENVTIDSNSSGVYTSLEMGRNSTLTVPDGENVTLYVTGLDGATGNFHIDGGDIIIGEGGSLTLILGNTSFLLENDTNFNQGGTPADFVILGTDQFTAPNQMRMENNGEIFAAIYVPRVGIYGSQGNTNLDIYGAMISYSMDFKSNTNLHYDEALGDLLVVEGGLPYWKITSWQQPYNSLVIE